MLPTYLLSIRAMRDRAKIAVALAAARRSGRWLCRERLGGLLRHYERRAA